MNANYDILPAVYATDNKKEDTLYKKIIKQTNESNSFLSDVRIGFSEVERALSGKVNFSGIQISKNVELDQNGSIDVLAKDISWNDVGSSLASILKDDGLSALKELGDFSLNVLDNTLTNFLFNSSAMDMLYNGLDRESKDMTVAEKEKKRLSSQSKIIDALDSAKQALMNEHNPVWALSVQNNDLMKNMYEIAFYSTSTESVVPSSTTQTIFNTRIRGIKIPTKKQETFEWNTPIGKITKVASDFSFERTLELEIDLDQPLFVFDMVNGKIGDMRMYSSRMKEKAKSIADVLDGIPAVYQKREDFTLQIKVQNSQIKDEITNDMLEKGIVPKEMMKTGDVFVFEGLKYLGRSSALKFERENANPMKMTAKFTYKKVYML